MEIQDNFQDDLIFKIDFDEKAERQEKKQKKIVDKAIKSIKKLALAKISGRVGEC